MEFYGSNSLYYDNLMLIDDQGMRITYGGFDAFYETVEKKFEANTLMFLFCENAIGSVLFYLTCLRKGIVPLLLDVQMDSLLADRLFSIYEPDYVAMPAEMSMTCKNCGGKPIEAGYGYLVIERETKNKARVHEDLALLLTTSGSTGSPKLVRQSRRNINSNAASIAEYLELSDKERPITVLPMHYTYGLSIINSHLLVGGTILLTKHTLFEKEFWNFFKKEEATSISGVPYTYEILKRLGFFKMNLPSLRYMTQAGGKLSWNLHREFAEYARENGRKFIVMYGQTEATARMGYLPAEVALEKCGSMGIAIPGGKFRLMEDEQTEVTEADVVGELVYEGANVTMGYAEGLEDLVKGDERGGILFTGDMAKRDSEGYYYITGRKKRFLKMFGKRVNMDEIEQLLKVEYEGIDVACVGEDDQMKIFLCGAAANICADAERRIVERTGIHPRGFEVLMIDEIPKNEAGKTLYQKLAIL